MIRRRPDVVDIFFPWNGEPRGLIWMDRFGKDLYIKLLSSFIFLLSFLPGSECIIQWPRHLLNPGRVSQCL
ncbi:hypothetical protein LOK49_LG13G01839 [Camellia lanceoleosa]|uniref:Uncharacterized protein n=1 Tax=Camellia lanceoleosa TaxID=1840588 RepID=A0ACC0FGX2_9ERIC|nr:hypothetical protein LOK49_LG13G01839 [Camellia lanceoleosa]